MRRRANVDPDERREAGRALSSALRVLKLLRGIFIADAVVLGFVLLLALSTDSLLAKAIGGVLFLAAVAGSIHVVRHPVPSTITLAVLHTPAAILGLLVGGGIGSLLVVALAVLLWLTVPMALRARTITRLHPDLWAARQMRGERPDPRRIGRKRAEQDRRRRRRNLLGVLLFGVVPLAVLLAGHALLGTTGSGDGPAGSPKPAEHLQATAYRLRAAWNASRHDEVKSFLADSERARISRLLDKIWRRKGWTETLPRASTPDLVEHSEWQCYAHYPIDGYGQMKTSWEWEKSKWVLVRVRFQKSE